MMKLPRRRFLHLAAAAVALPAVSRIAWAQTYPSRPITKIMPHPLTAAQILNCTNCTQGDIQWEKCFVALRFL
jgi:hypothetical protein